MKVSNNVHNFTDSKAEISVSIHIAGDIMAINFSL